MFSINPNFNAICSYEQATKSWQSGIIFPKDRKHNPLWAPRGLVDTRKRHMTIERTTANDFILRLYGFAVVTWHPDNSFTIGAYSTRSTVVFANRCTPSDVFVAMRGNHFSVTSAGRTYRVDKQVPFRKSGDAWEPDQIRPWKVPAVNRERAAKALREMNYKEFRLWLKVYVQMAPAPRHMWVDNHMAVTLLRDRSKWRDLAGRFPESWSSPDLVLSKLRQAIYHEYDCIEHKDVPYLKSNS